MSGTAVVITGRNRVNYTGVEALTVNGNAGSDTFNVTPSNRVAMFIDGGDPIGAKPGDLLNIIAGGGSPTFNAGPEADEGSFVVGVSQPVSFDHIESLQINGKPLPGSALALTVNGNAGSDTFNVTPSNPVAMFIDGGDPIGAKPGDLLNIIAGGSQVTFNAGPQTDEGSFVVGASQPVSFVSEPVSFDHIESLQTNGKPFIA